MCSAPDAHTGTELADAEIVAVREARIQGLRTYLVDMLGERRGVDLSGDAFRGFGLGGARGLTSCPQGPTVCSRTASCVYRGIMRSVLLLLRRRGGTL